MSEQTKIQWCDSTINFWSGCTPCSPGCANCYAAELANRFPAFGRYGKGQPRKWHESAVKEALRLNRKPWVCECGHAMNDIDYRGFRPRPCGSCGPTHRRRVFSLSLGDWLDPEVPIDWLARMLDTIRQCDQVEWILCTKRPELFDRRLQAVIESQERYAPLESWLIDWAHAGNAPRNITILATVENQEQADKRIPELIRIPAARRGLSLEPLLGPVELEGCLGGVSESDGERSELNWLIIGGESGPKARPCNVEWMRSLVKQGKAAGVATFVKQLGSRPQWGEFGGHLGTASQARTAGGVTHPKGADPAEWPEDLRVREWPTASP